MPHFVYRVPLLALLLASTAVAQQSPVSRPLRQRSVTLPAKPGEAVVHVARGFVTTLTFDSALASRSVVLQGRETHFERVDEDERLVSIKPKVELADGERLLLTVRFADGAAPQEATFELVSGPVEVDAQVEVTRRARSPEALEARLADKEAQLAALRDRCGEGGAAGVVFAGLLDVDIRGRLLSLVVPGESASGLKIVRGEGYRTRSWALVTLRVLNLPGQRPWALGALRLSSTKGAPVKVLSARMERTPISSGEEGLLVIQTESPWWAVGQEFRLELTDTAGGRLLPVSGIVL